jgi:hypothetical protein
MTLIHSDIIQSQKIKLKRTFVKATEMLKINFNNAPKEKSLTLLAEVRKKSQLFNEFFE